jgi:hypothetical protein
MMLLSQPRVDDVVDLNLMLMMLLLLYQPHVDNVVVSASC